MIRLASRALYFARSAWLGIRATPGTALVATATIAIALVLVGAFALLVVNMQGLLVRFGDALQVTAFLEEGLPAGRRVELAREAAAIDGVAGVRVVSEEEALDRFRAGAGRGFALLEGLGENPLPASLEIGLAPGQRDAAALERVSAQVARLPGVADVGSGSDWVEGYVRAVALVRALAIGLGVILALGTILIVSNTIRLAVVARRDEIEILTLVGASRAFVRTPYLIEGALQGAAGGLAAWVTLYLLFRLMLPGFEFGLELVLGGVEPRFFDGAESLWLCGGGALLGLLGSAAALASEHPK